MKLTPMRLRELTMKRKSQNLDKMPKDFASDKSIFGKKI